MNASEFLERYEARGDERDYLPAKQLYESALVGAEDAQLANSYGYLLECHARNGLRRAVALYERAIALDPDFDKPHYQLGGEAKSGLGDVEGAPADLRLALELEPEDIGARYSSAFLLEREGRLDGAAEAWQAIVDWSEARGLTVEAEWPRRELERLRAENADG
jgi:tetratricopeptide (TPR) repeat protein